MNDKSNVLPMDIQQLVQQIKQEAKKQEQEKKETEFQPTHIENSFLSALMPSPESDVDELNSLSPEFLHLNDFLLYQGREFVKQAFKAILLRKADRTGLENNVNFLRSGGSRQVLLVSLMLSEEGQKTAVHIKGMKWLIFRTKVLAKLGFVGRMLQPLANFQDWIVQPKLTTVRGQVKVIERQQRDLFALIEKNWQQHIIILNKILHQQEQNQFQQIDINKKLQQQLQTTQDHLAEVRRQFSYQQRNQELFLQQLIADNDQLLSRQSGLEKNAKGASGKQQQSSLEKHQQLLKQHSNDKLDAYYIAFEDACRGTREEIRKKFKVYLPLLEKNITPLKQTDISSAKETDVLDLGCGRGEWLQLLNKHNWRASGIDANKIMVQDCQKQGLDVQEADVNQYLKQQASDSVSAISSFHLIEHIPFSDLLSLFEETIRILRPGGLILFETPNPENLLVGSHTFYHDPTHRNPLTPTSMQFLARYTGYTQIEIMRIHPYPDDAKVPGDDPLTERVNGHLCGPQDYALIAKKPLQTSGV